MNTSRKAKRPDASPSGLSKSPTRTETQCSAKSTATEAQRDRVLNALRRRPQTTSDLRALGVYQVATRIKELRDLFDVPIETTRITVVDPHGYTHARAALYSLVDRQQGGSA